MFLMLLLLLLLLLVVVSVSSLEEARVGGALEQARKADAWYLPA